ncbi:MAG: efflux RND transporter periplasmic adaptor subunit [Candidatus Obscuribacterales bacterium]|nr:efflux RND transporter periplasmic adaptor subunit [Candidatus Obscuribacterales bacterium]
MPVLLLTSKVCAKWELFNFVRVYLWKDLVLNLVFEIPMFDRYKFTLLSGLLVGMLFLSACGQSPEKESSEAPKTEEKAATKLSDIVTLSAEAAAGAGIKSALVESKAEAGEIQTTGEIKADEGRVFHINSIVSGRVVKDSAALGQLIKEGQVLAVVQNLEVSKVYGDFIHQSHQNEVTLKEAQERLDLYKKTLERSKKLFDEGIGAQKDVLAAQNQVNLTEIELKGLQEHALHIRSEAEAMLSAYGVKITDTDSHAIETGSPLKAPRSGVIIQKNITLGDVVTADQPLYVVADLSKVWLDVAVYDKDLDSISVGEKVSFKSDSLAGRVFEGEISYIPPSANNMRTFTARAVFPNPGLVLKPGMFGRAVIVRSRSNRHPYLPDSAIQKFGNETFVFCDLGDNKYRKRVVQLGSRLGDGYSAASGVESGERVVVEGSFKLKSEMLKGQMADGD